MIKKIFNLFFILGFISAFAQNSNETKIALILDRGGKDDKSFNTAAYLGATRAKKELNVFVKTIEVSDDTLFEPAIRSLAQKKYDLIICIGFAQVESVKKVSKLLPHQNFAIVDGVVDAPNVASLIFEEQEGSYLVGFIAGLKTKSNKVGFIGGMDVPLIRRFEMAYFQGAKDANPKIQKVSNFIGVTSESWNNPTKAKEIVLTQFDLGVDVIFGAAGASNAGLFDAVEEVSKKNKKYVIGVDSNQNWIKPKLVLTSMLKRVDNAVFDIIKKVQEKKFQGGVIKYNLKSQGVDWALDEYNRDLFTKEELNKIENVKKSIISGKIKVLDYYVEMKKN